MASMSELAFSTPSAVVRPGLRGSRSQAPALAAPQRLSAASGPGGHQASDAAWRLVVGVGGGLVLRSLATRRRAYGERSYGGGRSSMLSPQEIAMRTEAKRQREVQQFWNQRERAARVGNPHRDDRYWSFEEKRLYKAAHVSKGINFDKYDNIPVETTGGQGTEQPLESFGEIGEKFHLPEELAANLERMNYDKPTPVQKYSIPAAMVGTDVMVSAQTGSGKTAAFLVPIVATTLRDGPQEPDSEAVAPTSVILAPTRELCQQIGQEAKRFCFKTNARAVEVYGGADAGTQLRDLAQGADIVIATPGRLEDFLDRGVLTMENVKHLTLDEADRMLDMGFEPQIRKIIEEHGMPPPGLGDDERQTTMFSATFPQEMQDMALDFLDPGYMWIAVGAVGSVNSNVDQHFVDATMSDKFDELLNCMKEVTNAEGGPAKTLVFANQKSTVDDICWRLTDSGIRAAPIHGGLSQPARDRALANLKAGRVQAVIATDVAARGLDLPGIDHVVNYDLPLNGEDYVHRIGRTGRIGNKGRATSMVGFNEAALKDIVRCLQDARREDDQVAAVPDWVEEQAFQSKGRALHRYGQRRGGGGEAPPF